jgi:hypothetical protein
MMGVSNKKRKEKTMSTKWITLCDQIDDGEYDEGLNEIVKTINMRREVVIRRKARRLALEIEVKDKVILTNGIKPKYLDGTTGHVVGLQGDSAIVMLDDLPSHAGRPSKTKQSKKFVIPLVHIEKIDEDTESLTSIDDDDFLEDDDEDE